MINSAELRIDNCIYYGSIKTVVAGVDGLMGKYLDYDGDTYDLSDCFPIPLTEEILLKCGFVDGKFGMEIKIQDKYTNTITIFFEGGHICIDGYATSVSHLHELQNIYYWLSGKKELEVKL